MGLLWLQIHNAIEIITMAQALQLERLGIKLLDTLHAGDSTISIITNSDIPVTTVSEQLTNMFSQTVQI